MHRPLILVLGVGSLAIGSVVMRAATDASAAPGATGAGSIGQSTTTPTPEISEEEAVAAAEAIVRGSAGDVALLYGVTVGDLIVYVDAETGEVIDVRPAGGATEPASGAAASAETQPAATATTAAATEPPSAPTTVATQPAVVPTVAAVPPASEAADAVLEDGRRLLPEATLTVDQAVAAALRAAPGEVRKVELLREEGRLMFEVTVGGQEVYVDAATGAVVDIEPATGAG